MPRALTELQHPFNDFGIAIAASICRFQRHRYPTPLDNVLWRNLLPPQDRNTDGATKVERCWKIRQRVSHLYESGDVRYGSQQDPGRADSFTRRSFPADVIVSPDTRRAGARPARAVAYTKVAGAGRQRAALDRPGRLAVPIWGLVGKDRRVELGGIWKSSARPGFRGFPLRHAVVAAGKPLGGRFDPRSSRAGRRRAARSALRPGARIRPRLDHQPAAR